MADGNGGGTTIESISIRISASSKAAANSIDKLTDSLGKLRGVTATGIGNLGRISGELKGLSSTLGSLKGFSSPVTSLAKSLERLNTIDVGKAANSLRDLNEVSRDLAGIENSVDGIRAFRSGVNSLLTSIERLQNADLSNVSDRIEEIVRAIRPLTDEMIRAGTAMSNFGQVLRTMTATARSARGFNTLNNQLDQYNTRVVRANNSSYAFRNTLRKFVSLASITYIFREIGQALAATITRSTDYIEAMNLATVSLGELADEAVKFSNNISSALGVDQGEILKNMGLFQNLATSFGVANEQAYILSKGMTQLAYDFASFHNLDIEESFLKFQSALAGELEPIRRVGVDISNARLQQELYDLGLKENISTLNRADKAILTYIAIMKQSTNEMGDMARTINTPANMLRVLGNQFVVTARQIGNIFTPALQAILPWAIAATRVLGQLAGLLASLVGFKMPEITGAIDTDAFSGVSSGLEDVGDAAESAAKKVNHLIGGFDELNILQKNSGAESAGAGIGSVLGGIDLSDMQYDMLEGLIDPKIDQYVRKLTKSLNDFFTAFKNSAGVQLITILLKALWSVLKPIGEWIIAHPDTVANWLAAIGVALITYKLVTGLGKLVTAFKALKGAVSTGGLLGGLRALGGILTNPWAIAIAAVAAAITLVGLSIWKASQDAKKARLDSIFGDLVLSFEEIQQAATALSTTELSIKLDYYVQETDALAEMYDTVQNTLTELQTQQWLAQLGVDIDLDAYSISIDNLIAQTQEALNQQEHVYTMSISIGVNNEGVASEMTDFVKEYMASSRTQLEALGKELRKTVDDALADGVLSGDELETITNLQKEMQEVMDRVTQANLQAEWTAFTMDWSGVDLQFESWQQVMDAANEMIQEQMKEIEGIRLQNLQIAELALAEGTISPEKYADWVSEIERSFMENKLNLTAQLDQFAINTVDDSYTKVLEDFATEAANDVSEAFENAWITAADGTKTFNVTNFMATLEYEIKQGLPGLKGAVSSILENIKPQESEWLAQKAYYESMGMEVPESISKGLSEVEKLRGLTENTELLYSAIMGVLQNSPEVKAAITEAGLTGEDLAGTLLDGIVDTGNAGLPIITEESDKIYNAAISKLDKEGAKVAGAGVASGTTAGITEQVDADLATIESKFTEIPDAAGDALGLDNKKEKSSLFESMGLNTGGSFLDGLKEAWTSVTNWWNSRSLKDIKAGVEVTAYQRGTSVGGIPQVDYLASGNVATDPTLAIFGEYPGAKSNPEITAPQSTIYETVVAANSEMVGAVYQMAGMIVQAIEDNSTEISADSKGIFKAVKKEADKFQKSHGVPAF